ncbi:MAG: alpha/beta fold hydrolase [Pseudomonadota bacterium]
MKRVVDVLHEGQTAVEQSIAEGGNTISYLRNLARGNQIERQAFQRMVSAGQPPVLLIHGFLSTRGSMFRLEQHLRAEGIPVLSFKLGLLNTCDIRRSSYLVYQKIESILAQTGIDRIDIVGHSMGGLIGLYYIKRLGGDKKVRKLILLGTPLAGTWTALLGVAALGVHSSGSWQLLPGSSFLKELAAGPLPSTVECHTIAAERDWLCPSRSTKLEGATAVTVPFGHSSLVVSPDVFERIRSILKTPPATAVEATAKAKVAGR